MGNIRLALRHLLKSPFVTGVAVASLALGIGANTAIFSLVDQMLLRPLPVVEPGRLVNFKAPGPNPGSQSCSQIGECDEVFSYPMFLDLQREQQVFTDIAAHVSFGANLSAQGQTLSGEGLLVSGSYFPVLGLVPALGRLIGPDDADVVGDGRVAVLAYDYWKGPLGGDPDVLSKTLIVNGQSLEIIGVAPRGFKSTSLGVTPRVFVPITLRSTMIPGWGDDVMERRRAYWAYLFGRLKPGVSIEQASASINPQYTAILENTEVPLQQGMSDKTMQEFRTKKIILNPGSLGQSSVRTEASTPLSMLFGITLLVLLIACANISNLLLARGAARSGEMAVRLAIGGTRWQLVSQLLTESIMLGVLGGVAGLGVAVLTLRGMSSIMPQNASSTFVPHLDGTVIAFAALLAIVTSVLFGLFPALHGTRPDLIATIREQGGQPAGGRAAARWRTGLATAQIGLALALLASAGLFTKSLMNVTRLDLGVKVDHVATFGVSPELNGYPAERSRQLFQRLTDELEQTPGVVSVSAAMVPLIGGSNWGNDVGVEGYPKGPDVDNNSRFNMVGPGYFETVGIPVLVGRGFTRSDVLGAPKVAVVNQAFAKKFNLGANPVGRRMDQGNDSLDIEIVGLVQDAKYSDVKRDIPPLFFRPYMQDERVGALSFYVKSQAEPGALLPVLSRVVKGLDENLPVEELRTMPEQIRDNVFLDRFVTLFSAAFALLATLLAAIGLYGVLAYTVAQRTREFGVRMALGADPARVRGMVLLQVGKMTLIGGAVGLLAAFGIGRVAQSLLFQMQGSDPVVFVLASLALALVALAAGLIPAYRASRLDPVRALRYE
ncbi:MAG TPA: ABC transporter permease [Gemmatimonadales bacterium]|nr:ABC transporter permease [Gemmatimonadales bacterium]